MYTQMRSSYECDAEYVIIFNYAENMTGPYGTLQEEHFQALERFWNEVVQNPNVAHGGIKAEAELWMGHANPAGHCLGSMGTNTRIPTNLAPTTECSGNTWAKTRYYL